MIAAFYGVTGGGAATTSNLLCTALMSYFQYRHSVLMVSLSSGLLGLETALKEKESYDKVAEEAEYFYAQGMDQVLKEASCETLQPSVVFRAAKEVIPGKVRYLSTARGSCFERVWKEMERHGSRILDVLEECAELIFLDCGSGTGVFMKEIQKRADVIVVNLIQNQRILKQFFCNKHFFIEKTVYLTGRYEEFFPCNRNRILKEGRMLPEDLSEISYNAGFLDAFADGKCAKFLERNAQGASYEKNRWFIRQVKGATDMILRKGGYLG